LTKSVERIFIDELTNVGPKGVRIIRHVEYVIKSITFISELRFFSGDAVSICILGIGKVMKEEGYQVSFVGKSGKRNNDDIFATFCGFPFYNVFVREYSFIGNFF